MDEILKWKLKRWNVHIIYCVSWCVAQFTENKTRNFRSRSDCFGRIRKPPSDRRWRGRLKSIIFLFYFFIGVKQALMDRRRQLEFSIYPYESHTRRLVSKLMDMKEQANDYVVRLKEMETYRWSVSVGEYLSNNRSARKKKIHKI